MFYKGTDSSTQTKLRSSHTAMEIILDEGRSAQKLELCGLRIRCSFPRMQKVRGIGGIFFKSKDPKALAAWYRDVLGVPLEEWGGAVFPWQSLDGSRGAATVWSTFPDDTKYFAPSEKPFMLNFVVDDVDAMLQQARAAGATVDEKVTDDFNGRFGWLLDPEGNRIELWQPCLPQAASA